MKHFKYFYKMSRPLNVLIAGFTILIAAIVTGQFEFSAILVFAILTASFITSGANIVNDIFDIEIDRINKPKRLLPSGKVSLKSAWIYFIISYFLAIILALLSGWFMFIIAFSIGILLYTYSSYFKRTVLWGNIVVSFSTAIAFIYGAEAVGHWKAGIIPAFFSLFFHFGREVIKDMQDMEGDLAHNAVTFAGKFGKQNSIFLVNVVFFILILLTLVPYLLNIYNISYLWIVVFGVDLVLAGVSVIIWFRNDVSALGKVSHLLKLDMFVGLIAIYFGVIDVSFIN